MYSEPFRFHFSEDLPQSAQMSHLSELFLLSEQNGVHPLNYCGYTIQQNKGIKFSSSHPDLTQLVVHWLQQRVEKGILTVDKPKNIMDY